MPNQIDLSKLEPLIGRQNSPEVRIIRYSDANQQRTSTSEYSSQTEKISENDYMDIAQEGNRTHDHMSK